MLSIMVEGCFCDRKSAIYDLPHRLQLEFLLLVIYINHLDMNGGMISKFSDDIKIDGKYES